jgi:hypothetical protein
MVPRQNMRKDLKGAEGKHAIPELIISYFKCLTGNNISVPSQWS